MSDTSTVDRGGPVGGQQDAEGGDVLQVRGGAEVDTATSGLAGALR